MGGRVRVGGSGGGGGGADGVAGVLAGKEEKDYFS